MAFILAIDGPEGSGKTSLALSAYEVAPPVKFLELDGNAWIALRRFKEPLEQGLIKVEPIGDLGEEGDDPKKVKEAWSWLRAKVTEALSAPGTLVVDTADLMWHLIRLEKLANYMSPDKLNPMAYGPSNSWFDNFLQRCKKSQCNLVLVHRADHPWVVTTNPNGKTEMGYDERKWKRARAYGHVGFALHASVLTTKAVTQPTKTQKDRAEEAGLKPPKATLVMNAEFTECKVDPLLIGTSVLNPTFKKLWEKMGQGE